MKSVLITKQLNNTELSNSSMHDSYISIPQSLDISTLFPENDTVYSFVDRETGKIVPISFKVYSSGQRRITQLGTYYSEKQLCAGDRIILERRTIGSQDMRFIDYEKKVNRLVAQKSKHGYELLSPERINLFVNTEHSNGKLIDFVFLGAKRKRNDSPDKTDYYDITVGGESISKNDVYNDYVVMETKNNKTSFNRFCAWTKSLIETEGE